TESFRFKIYIGFLKFRLGAVLVYLRIPPNPFMEDFRTQFKEKHPNKKSVSVVGKAGGDKWKSLSDDENAPYVAKEEKRKVEYSKTMDAYNKKLAGG
ncbi:hypothetical protein MKX03_011811, partial [Papaver bracteatum]